MNTDRRRHPRFEVSGLVGTFEERVRFVVRVLGLGGMLVETTRELTPGQRGQFELLLPNAGSVRVAGRVLYLGPVGAVNSGAWRIGVAFEESVKADLSALETFLVGRTELTK